jgi:HD superfamily phosphohydrolase YqeK
VYLADYIEPGRTHFGVIEIRELAFADLERALLGAVNLTIKRVLERGRLLHPGSISFRNSLILSLRKK